MAYPFGLRLAYWEDGDFWFRPMASFLNTRFHGIENRMIATFDYITPDNSNRKTHSYMYASILRDIGSVFDSTMREILKNIEDNKHVDNINGFLKCLEDYDPLLNKRSLNFVNNLKILVPFERSASGLPEWWHAYNDVKHEELMKYYRGNLEFSFTALAALKLFHYSITQSLESRIFVNVGLNIEDSPDLKEEDLLFSGIVEDWQ